jgi:hypothetical protein
MVLHKRVERAVPEPDLAGWCFFGIVAAIAQRLLQS